ncbi:adenosylcobyric acid synthase [Amycolatopsis bartoniae]|uniref:Cobyric acid synthase n=1 Tax=Amycolatopsis bartoniae TaxID=941986 RepID=A0A8H9M9E6_9PSEU|nr:cobyric acid synthase [Amycolatopsis bartoniae]MBB2934283.1 adenosylcobyric acid synthase [Amycolatopsis bartoniae]TVT08482.1 cobyric acid synthase [Amycolatopsis bartoniae]GHF48512.1 cobyric acid synthase [Amycolatopsis bartoniae]
MRGLLIAGTTSDAGKSLVTAGICRWLARQGLRVAPFKAQNMSNNSMVCADGAEIGRAQWLQARAAGVEPEAAMNPVLLKPGSDSRSHVIALGKPFGTLEAGEYATGRKALAQLAFDTFEELRTRFDVVVCEGAGSPAEINLRARDYVNLGLARRFDLPVLVVGDIDRGGVLAAMYGTQALLDPPDQGLLSGWIVNKFRGDIRLLRPGLDRIADLTGRPVLGVLPWLDGVWIDSEDALAAAGWRREQRGGSLRVAVVRFPRASNATDVDALAAEPGVSVQLTADPDVVRTSDIVVLPGTRATVDDLSWLRARGIDGALNDRVRNGRPVLGICGGYQMLAEEIRDDVESGAGVVPGLGLLPTTVSFTQEKVLARPVGRWRGHEVEAYEIHHGSATAHGEAEPFLDGWRRGPVWGTTWHGTLDNDGFRRAWLIEAAAQAGVTWSPSPGAPGFAALRESMLDRLADAVAEHLDTEALLRLATSGAPSGQRIL